MKKKSRRKRRRKAPRPPSWIWVTTGEQYDPADGAAMNEAVRIEWAKIRARSHRWREEVDLLEEEMTRSVRYCERRSDWWREWVGARGLAEGPQLEGEASYAVRQAEAQAALAIHFAKEWQALPELIRRGRAGELEVMDDGPGDEDDQEDWIDSDSDVEEGDLEEYVDSDEEAAIPELPQGAILSTYVDEILVM
ncbi:hypothetical protein C8R47DRAFT_1229521 [Mycena vitilis]|nr:hypothetical protein C8R47DRAFT_1229521 [Mycena vitilis]